MLRNMDSSLQLVNHLKMENPIFEILLKSRDVQNLKHKKEQCCQSDIFLEAEPIVVKTDRILKLEFSIRQQ